MIPRSFGKYAVVRSLGSGGMAAVYEAQEPLLDRRVAIKVIHPHLAEEPTFSERFSQEARLVASLRHPHVVRLHDYDIFEGQPYMVMEFLEGGTLEDLLRETSPPGAGLPLGQVAALLRNLTDALAYAHEQGAVHRDIKPANILFTGQGEPVITDFGIAKLLYESVQISATGGMIGTPAYMSPEQISGEPVDGRSDQYALGIVVYEMTTGRVPFMAESPTGVLMKHLNEPPPAPRELNPNLPGPVQQVILRALAKRPEDRFPSIRDFSLALEAALQGISPETAPSEAEETAERPPAAGSAVPEILTGTIPDTIRRPPTTTPKPTEPDSEADLSTSQVVPAPEEGASKAVSREGPAGWLRGRAFRLGLLGLGVLVVVLFLALGGAEILGGGAPPLPESNGYLIAVADFDGSSSSIEADFGRRIFEQLQQETSGLDATLRVVRLREVLADEQSARDSGQGLGASMVIWGWYDDLGVSPQIEFIEPAATLQPVERSSVFVSTANAAGAIENPGALAVDLNDFYSLLRSPRILADLDLFVENGPQQVAYLSEAVLGMAFQSQGDHKAAVELFDQALSETGSFGEPEAGKALGLDLVYFQRGLSRWELGRQDQALSDFEMAVVINPELFEAHFNLAILYPERCTPDRQIDRAIAEAQTAVALQPEDLTSRRLLAGLLGQRGDLTAALQDARAAEQIAPADPETQALLADLYRAAGQEDAARAAYQASIERYQDGILAGGHDDFSTWIAMGDLHLSAGDIQAAEESYDHARRLRPEDPEIQRAFGNLAFSSGDVESAVQAYSTWVELEPASPAALNALGAAQLRIGQTEEALANLVQAASLTACNAAANLLLGSLFWEVGDYPEAEAAWEQVTIVEPFNADAHFLLAMSQFFQDETEAAAVTLDQTLTLDSTMVEALYARGSIYYSGGDYPAALSAWQQASAARPDEPAYHTSLGNVYEELGRLEEAVAAYQRSLELREDNQVRVFLGLALTNLGDFTAAIDQFLRAVEQDSYDALAHSGLAFAYLQAGELDAAARAYRDALAIDEEPSWRVQLGIIQNMLGRPEEAILELEMAVSEHPQNETALSILAGLYGQLSRLDEAEARFQDLLALNPDLPDAHTGLGRVAYKRCDLDQMAREYTQAAALGGDSALYQSLPVAVHLARGEGEKLGLVLSQLETASPQDPLAHLLVGEAYFQSGDAGEAEVALNQAISLPGLPPALLAIAYFDLGQIRWLAGDMAGAELAYRQALEADPVTLPAELALADLSLLAGDGEAALVGYERSVSLLPIYGAAAGHDLARLIEPLLEARRSLALKLLGRDDEAEQAMNRSLELSETLLNEVPTWPQANFARAGVLWLAGEQTASEEAFSAAEACDASLVLAAQRTREIFDELARVVP